MNTELIYLLIIGSLVGAASGYLGSFMVLKRMSLVGDALSHVALPGIAIALMIGLNPMLGAFMALLVAIIGIWYFSEKSEIYPEAIVGIFFTVSLAIGILITPEPEVFEILFGDIDKVTNVDGLFILVGSIIIFLTVKLISKKLILGIISEDLAKSQKVDISKINLIYLLLVGLVVALGIKFLGTLLTGALVIIPAVAAKNITLGIYKFQTLSILFGIISVFVGILLAKQVNLPTGPIVVLVSSLIFLLSNLIKRN